MTAAIDDALTPTSRPQRRGGRPSSAEAEQLGDTLLEAAQRVFIERGFDAASMEAIAAEAGITKRTLYRRMADKTALFEAVLRRHAERHGSFVLGHELAGSLDARLFVLAERLLEWILRADTLALYRVSTAQALRVPALAEGVNDMVRQAHAAIHRVLDSEMPGHGIDISFAADMFLQVVAAEPFNRAVQGIAPAGLSQDKLARCRRSVSFFLRAWNSSTQAPPAAF